MTEPPDRDASHAFRATSYHCCIMAAVKAICVCHDIERGLGHVRVEPEFARVAEAGAEHNLGAMLDIEAAAGIAATYNVVGAFLPEVRTAIEANGHCLGFHSFDHDLESPQLARCRAVDSHARRTPS